MATSDAQDGDAPPAPAGAAASARTPVPAADAPSAADASPVAVASAVAAAAPGPAPAGPPARRRASRARPERRVEGEPAFLLHSIPYRETSLVLELFTRDHGRVAAVARGAKRPRSSLRAVLLAFQPLQVTWTGGSELRSLVAAEWLGGLPVPQGDGLICAFYLNELLLKLLPREDPHPALFDGYVEALGRLAHDEPLEPVLRRFEWLLLRESGFGIDLRHDSAGRAIDPARRYALLPGAGFVPAAPRLARPGDGAEAGRGDFAGSTLLELAEGRLDDPAVLAEAKLLTRVVLARQLEGQRLSTRQILKDLQRL